MENGNTNARNNAPPEASKTPQPDCLEHYNVRAGQNTASIMLICGILCLLIGLIETITLPPGQPGTGYSPVGGLLGGLLIIAVAVCGIKTRSRRKSWVKAYMVMSIFNAGFGMIPIFSGIVDTIAGFSGPYDTGKNGQYDALGSLGVIVFIAGLVDFFTTIVAAAICCRGICNCCRIQVLIPPIPDGPRVNQYQIFEDETEPVYEVNPDTDGLYTDYQVTMSHPTTTDCDPSENYAMHRSLNKGLVLIINNYSFRKERRGSEIDLANVQHLFTEIGYCPVIKQNLTANGIREVVNYVVTKINQEGSDFHSSVVVVLMSHGDRQGIYGTDEQVVRLKDIQDKFTGRNCPALIDKPKIFFIQACRGQERTKSALDTDSRAGMDGDNQRNTGIDSCHTPSPVDQINRPSTSSSNEHDIEPDWDIPDNADMYVAHATSPGYFSLRDNVHGSWFIQALCEELLPNVHVDDLDTMMTRVTRRVTGKTGYLPDGQGGKKKILQTPHISKQGIRKKIFFFPKFPPLQEPITTANESG